MSKPQHAGGYEDRKTEAVRRVLIDVAHLLGGLCCLNRLRVS